MATGGRGRKRAHPSTPPASATPPPSAPQQEGEGAGTTLYDTAPAGNQILGNYAYNGAGGTAVWTDNPGWFTPRDCTTAIGSGNTFTNLKTIETYGGQFVFFVDLIFVLDLGCQEQDRDFGQL